MKEDYLIRIEGRQEQDGEENAISLVTRGSFVQKGANYYITYKETEATGFIGCTTTVKIEGEDRVTMLRHGPAPSQLVIEKGRRNVCLYETGHGSLSLGISADGIKARLGSGGGEVEFCYLLDMNAACFSKNTVKITVREG
ncbi:MAG: DUF1934 domain-containing protein [Oscillospiraceae bacterium]|nr:DUF1934 domain-containing protein [Oscillospiraceae bacterium]